MGIGELCPLWPLRQAQDRLKATKDTDVRVENVSFVALGEVAEADYFKERRGGWHGGIK
jgi:hypothetical protein